MKKGEFRLIFSGQDDAIGTSELGDFLLLFKAVYTAALSQSRNLNLDKIYHKKAAIKKSFINHLKSLNYHDINALFTKDLGHRNLLAKRIIKESPWEITVCGVISAIALAVIISGGHLKLGLFEAHVGPLGDGIRKFRDALAPSKSSEIGYSIKSRRIKLLKKEYIELKKYKIENAKKGGFQKFFASLLLRVNPKTYEIDLTSTEIDYIIKYGRQHGTGGFQLSLKKIFENHFIF